MNIKELVLLLGTISTIVMLVTTIPGVIKGDSQATGTLIFEGVKDEISSKNPAVGFVISYPQLVSPLVNLFNWAVVTVLGILTAIIAAFAVPLALIVIGYLYFNR